MHDQTDPDTTALAGLRVVDLTQVMAGPFCTMILADLGADVIKVENPESGDQTRSAMAHPGAFHALNRNKRSITLDLKSDAGRATFHELARSADGTVKGIGGIQQKIVGALDAGATVFLVPEPNCQEALGADVDESDITLVEVATLGDAVDALTALADDASADVPTCG